MSARAAAGSVLQPGLAAPRVRLLDDGERWRTLPFDGCTSLLVFYRGDWCPWCNGQLAGLARRAQELEALGVRVAAISVDPPAAGRAMRAKLRLPFALFSDADGVAIAEYGLWDAEERLALPGVAVIDRRGILGHLRKSAGFADRAGEDELLAALRRLA